MTRKSASRALFGTASAVLMAQAAMTAAVAQQQQQELEPVVVTGSRIRVDPLSQTQPVVQLGQEELAKTGLTSVADILQRMPNSGGALNSKFNNSGNFGNPPDGGGVGAGSAEVDLHYLGSRRVLVLVDGLRWVNGASASGVPSSTDLNTIPAAMIERVEVLQDGASSIYGSDAISGVVNIITKKKMDGFEGSAYVGAYEHGDGTMQDYNLTFGNNTDRMSIVVGGQYVKQNAVSSGDRDISLFPNPGSTDCTGGGCSSGTPLGRFILDPDGAGPLDFLDMTLKGPVAGAPAWDPADPFGAGSGFKGFTDLDRYNFAPSNYIVTPSERIGAFANVTFDLHENVTFKGKAVYNSRKSANQAAPLPLFVGPDAGNGNLLDTITIDASNPYNPFGITLEPGNFAFIGRRMVETGPRHYEQNVSTWYLSGSFEGKLDFGDKPWFWDINGIWTRNRADQTFDHNVNAQRLQQALGPVDECTGACVPFNIFGGEGSITNRMLDFVGFTQSDKSQQSMIGASANLSGELFDLPAGPVGMAVGAEYRRLRGSFTPDSTVAAGLGSDIPALPTHGKFNVKEIYGELRVPLLKDMPAVELLEASYSVRHSDYSTFGGTTKHKVGLNWRPTTDLLLRGSWAQGFRAPGIGELFGSLSRFDQEIADPCSGATDATVIANCRAEGVPDGYTQINAQLSVITGGNANLKPETSRSWVVGGVYSPSWAQGGSSKRLDLELNYFDIKLNNAIQAYGAEVLLARCAEQHDALSCAAITRTSSGNVAAIAGVLQNIGQIRTKGLDATLNWRGNEGAAGAFGLTWANSFLFDYVESIPATVGFTDISREGTERGSPDQAYPKWKSNVVLDWAKDAISASLTGRYISKVTEGGGLELKSRFYTDLQVTWKPEMFGENVGLTLGVNNILDSDPPACVTCSLNNYDPTTYDAPGRFGYLRLNVKM